MALKKQRLVIQFAVRTRAVDWLPRSFSLISSLGMFLDQHYDFGIAILITRLCQNCCQGSPDEFKSPRLSHCLILPGQGKENTMKRDFKGGWPFQTSPNDKVLNLSKWGSPSIEPGPTLSSERRR